MRSGFVLLVCMMVTIPARAQQSSVQWEVGGLIGRFSGLAVKAYPAREQSEIAIDIQMSINGKDYLALRTHVLTEHRLPASPLTFFLGPGATLGTDDSELFLGPAAEIGVFFGIDPYRVFLQAMPQLQLTPQLNGTILAAVGIRISI